MPFEARRFHGLAQSDIRRMTRECQRVGGINLAQGLCDLPVPEPVRRAAEAALRARTNTYSVAAGIPELRQAIARKLRRDNGLEVDPETEIVVTAGVTGGYFCALHGLLDPGDGILLFEPYYGYHRNIAQVQGLEPQLVALDPPHATVTEPMLRAALRDNTRAMVICTPSNPSGKMWDRGELEAVARIARERELLVITDEIYEYFTYDGRAHVSPASVGQLWPRTVSLMGYSKTFAITGWRIGYAVAPEPLARLVQLANDLCFICAPRPFQHAVAGALETLPRSWYQELADGFQARRDRTCDALAEAGFVPLAPQGSYYVCADVGALGFESAREAAMTLLESTGVATVPGTAFHAGVEGERFLRVCFAKEDDVLDDACRRLRGFRAPGVRYSGKRR